MSYRSPPRAGGSAAGRTPLLVRVISQTLPQKNSSGVIHTVSLATHGKSASCVLMTPLVSPPERANHRRRLDSSAHIGCVGEGDRARQNERVLRGPEILVRRAVFSWCESAKG